MKKKLFSTLGIAGLIGLSCNHETNSLVAESTSGAGRIVSVDSANDRVIIDTTATAVVRNVHTKPEIQITGLFSKKLSPRKGDILFFTIDSNSLYLNERRVESFRLFSYHMN